MGAMEFRVLGPLEAVRDGQALELGGQKQRALLALLLIDANRTVSRDRLIDALWEDQPTATAAQALTVYVSQLRKALGRDRVVTQPGGYVLRVDPDELDLERFQRLHGDGKPHEALALWRGGALAEFSRLRFAQADIARLEELHLACLEARIEADLERGRNVVGELEALVAAHPLRERLHELLMLALYRCGRQAEALSVYQEVRRRLVEELGIEPRRELRELQQAILSQNPALELTGGDRPVPVPAPTPAPAAARAPQESPARPAGAGEERKVVSVLLVDLVGFTARAELADPEDVRAALRPFHSASKREIERFGGMVEKVIGGPVIAVFGAPVAHEDDAERAVRAALAIRRWISEEGAGLQVRMAVNSGVALVSLDSRPEEGEPIAAGDVVHSAQRLQVAAPVNGILVGKDTYRATREAIDYCESALVEAKGKSAAIPAWEVLGARSRLGVDLVREPRTPLVGRVRELDLLNSALARVREERLAQLVTLVGVPGIGKSRLVFELSKTLEREDEPTIWRQGRCLPYGDGISFWALGEIVKAQAGILESDRAEQAEEKLRRSVVEVVADEGDAPWIAERLRPLIGAGGELGLGDGSGEAFAAWRRFLACLADRQPLVVALEDLHWADEGLLDFVDELADRLRDTPLLVLCTARPELLQRRPRWGGGRTNAFTISIPPLSDGDTAQLVAAVLERPLQAADQETLLARAAGNPLYAEQFARVLAELGTLEELPETVHGIIAARLDGLLPEEKALLQDAAVVGEVFWVGALAAMSGSRPSEELFTGLERREFLQQARRSSVAGESEYAFRHVLLRDVAYAQIPRAARGGKHRRAAAWIESLGRQDDHAEMLAHHYLSALEYTKAAGREDAVLLERARRALRAAGDRALSLASYTAAARFYRAALELWPETDPDRARLLINAGRASYDADRTGIDLLEQGFEKLRALGDADVAAEVAVEIARCWWFVGERDAAYSYVGRAFELAEGRTGSRARAWALVARAGYHMVAAEFLPAIRLAREALPLTEALGMDELRVRTLDVLGCARAMIGDVAGLDDSRRAVTLGREINTFFNLIRAEHNLYCSQFHLGHLEGASQTLSQLGRDIEAYGTAIDRQFLRGFQACAAAHDGRWNEATGMLDELIAEAESGVAHYVEPGWRALRASIDLARGNLRAASEGSKTSLGRARTTKDPQILAPALTLRATVLLAQGREREASALASEVLALGTSLAAAFTPEMPVPTLIDLAWLLHSLGREAELQSALDSAPATPWIDAARAIARGEFTRSVELIARIGVPSLEAYARLRAAEQLARAGHRAESRQQLAPALTFFTQVNATRYLTQAQALLAAN